MNLKQKTERVLTHQIKVNTMIDQIILTRFYILRCTKVDPILLANMLNLLISTRQAHNPGVELLQVSAEDLGGISGRIAGDENRLEDFIALSLRLDTLNDGSHFVKLVRTDIRAVGEAEVDLSIDALASSYH